MLVGLNGVSQQHISRYDMLTVRELLERESFFDAAILRHGFVDYMRDYQLIVSARNGPPYTDVHRYLFVGCVEAVYQSAIAPEHLPRSLPDDLVYSGPDYPDKDDPDGFIWGVRYANAYPGLSYIADGKRAAYWRDRLSRPMHDVFLETEAYTLLLVFADVRYEFLGSDDQPGLLPPKEYPITPVADDVTSDGGVQ